MITLEVLDYSGQNFPPIDDINSTMLLYSKFHNKQINCCLSILESSTRYCLLPRMTSTLIDLLAMVSMKTMRLDCSGTELGYNNINVISPILAEPDADEPWTNTKISTLR